MIDGRNRREGCRLAGVRLAVEYEEYAIKHDLLARIWSENGFPPAHAEGREDDGRGMHVSRSQSRAGAGKRFR